MSPLKDVFRKCTRNYPSIINCCTVDWLHGWPEDALHAIANRFLVEENLNDTDRGMAINMLIEFQFSAMEMAKEYYVQTQNPIFIPPVAYIDATNAFKNQLLSKKALVFPF